MKNRISPLCPAGPLKDRTCPHRPRCPNALAPDRLAARTVARHPEQGWSLLCNGIVQFEDAGLLLPDGRAVVPASARTVVAA
jgi:hypothetical protein